MWNGLRQIDLTKAIHAEENPNLKNPMITTDTITTEEQDIIAAIKRSICYDETVICYDEECNHLSTVEWLKTFCEEVGYASFQNNERRVWGEFHGQEFSILLS